MNVRPLAALAALAVTAFSAEALACGGYHDAAALNTMQVNLVAHQHFTAIQNADRSALRKLWNLRAGEVTQLNADGSVQARTPVRQNIDIWTAAPEPNATWEITQVTFPTETTSTVTASLTWNGSDFEEVLTLALDDGEWELVAKSYTVTEPAPAFELHGY